MLKIGKRSEKSIGNRLKNVFPMLVSFLGIESHFGKRNRCNKARTILVMQQGEKTREYFLDQQGQVFSY